jgi:hypothetical protein
VQVGGAVAARCQLAHAYDGRPDAVAARRVTAARAAYARAERELEQARAGFYAVIAETAASGRWGTQSELAALTGYSRERIRQIIREASGRLPG